MSKRAKKETTNSTLKTISEMPKRRVILLKNDLLQTDPDKHPLFIQLRHPSSGNGATFLISGDHSKIQEVVQFSDSKRSYFINESVSSDGNVYFCTPIDPLFLALPYFMKSKRCCPVDQTLVDDEYPDIERVTECEMDLNLIGDRRGDESLKAYIYNEEKTLLWLQVKLEKLINVLKLKNINTSKNVAVSANFVKSDQEEDSGVSYIRYSYSMLLDYIPEELATKFADFIKLPPEPEKSNKRKEIVSPSIPNGKKSKTDVDEEEYEYKTTPKVEKYEPKQRPSSNTGNANRSEFLPQTNVPPLNKNTAENMKISMLFDALGILKSIASSPDAQTINPNNFDSETFSFSNFICSKIQHYDRRTKSAVQRAIMEIIFKADDGCVNFSQNISTTFPSKFNYKGYTTDSIPSRDVETTTPQSPSISDITTPLYTSSISSELSPSTMEDTDFEDDLI